MFNEFENMFDDPEASIDEFGADLSDLQALSDDQKSEDMSDLYEEIETTGIIKPLQ